MADCQVSDPVPCRQMGTNNLHERAVVWAYRTLSCLCLQNPPTKPRCRMFPLARCGKLPMAPRYARTWASYYSDPDTYVVPPYCESEQIGSTLRKLLHRHHWNVQISTLPVLRRLAVRHPSFVQAVVRSRCLKSSSIAVCPISYHRYPGPCCCSVSSVSGA